MDCRGDPWIMVIFGWLSQNPPFYYYLESESAFKAKVDELCRELGERGKA